MATKKKTVSCRCLITTDRRLRETGYRVSDLLRLKGIPRRALVAIEPIVDPNIPARLFVKPKGLTLLATFCPFCGVKYPG